MAPLWGPIKWALSMHVSERAPAECDLFPPPLPFHLSAEASQCSQSHWEINAPPLPVKAKAAVGSALPLQCDSQPLCSSANGHTSLYLSWPLRLRAACGCYGVRAERGWFIPVVLNVVCSNVAMQLDVAPMMLGPLIYGAGNVGRKKIGGNSHQSAVLCSACISACTIG